MTKSIMKTAKAPTLNCNKAKLGNCRKGEHPLSHIPYCSIHHYRCKAPDCTWTPLQGRPCARHPDANPEQVPAYRPTNRVGTMKRNNHHCPREGQGNCRPTQVPGKGHTYCAKHQLYCPVELCRWTPIQGQGCPKHGKPGQKITYRK